MGHLAQLRKRRERVKVQAELGRSATQMLMFPLGARWAWGTLLSYTRGEERGRGRVEV